MSGGSGQRIRTGSTVGISPVIEGMGEVGGGKIGAARMQGNRRLLFPTGGMSLARW
jgi:hypothetical protein